MARKGKCFWMLWWENWRISDDHGVFAESRQPLQQQGSPKTSKVPSFFSYAKTVLFTRRRGHIMPNKRLHFLYEPNERVLSALKVKNRSRSFVAFKLQTNSQKICFAHPEIGILTPGETVLVNIAIFIEPSEHKQAKIKEKFKVLSLKVKKGVQYYPELFEEQKESVAVEGCLEVVYLDPHGRSWDIEKLKKGLAEAEASQPACKRSVEDAVLTTMAAGGALDEWQQKEQHVEKQQGS